MRKGTMIVLAAALVLLLAVIGGCGGGQTDEAATPPATGDATQLAETHDCDGGCGMKAVPLDKLTEINGKFYCAGCAAKAKTEESAEHPHG